MKPANLADFHRGYDIAALLNSGTTALMEQNGHDSEPPVSRAYRLVLGATMFPLFILFGLGFYFRIREPWKFEEGSQTPFLNAIAESLSWELHIAFFGFSLLTVMWAVAAPNWIARLLDKSADKALGLAFWMLVISVIYSWLS
jgi:hypothetical protein